MEDGVGGGNGKPKRAYDRYGQGTLTSGGPSSAEVKFISEPLHQRRNKESLNRNGAGSGYNAELIDFDSESDDDGDSYQYGATTTNNKTKPSSQPPLPLKRRHQPSLNPSSQSSSTQSTSNLENLRKEQNRLVYELNQTLNKTVSDAETQFTQRRQQRQAKNAQDEDFDMTLDAIREEERRRERAEYRRRQALLEQRPWETTPTTRHDVHNGTKTKWSDKYTIDHNGNRVPREKKSQISKDWEKFAHNDDFDFDLTSESDDFDDYDNFVDPLDDGKEHWYDNARRYGEQDDLDEMMDEDDLWNPSRGYYPKHGSRQQSLPQQQQSPNPRGKKTNPKQQYLSPPPDKRYAEPPTPFGNDDTLIGKTMHYLGRSIQDQIQVSTANLKANIASGLIAANIPNPSQQELYEYQSKTPATDSIKMQLMRSKNPDARRFLRELDSGSLSPPFASLVAKLGLVGAVRELSQVPEADDDGDGRGGADYSKNQQRNRIAQKQRQQQQEQMMRQQGQHPRRHPQQQRQLQQQHQQQRGGRQGNRQQPPQQQQPDMVQMLQQMPPDERDKMMALVGEILQNNDIDLEQIPEDQVPGVVGNVLTQLMMASMA